MSIITLTTDLGNKDYSVASLKGSILQNFEDAKIVDISHEIKHHDILQAAYVLKNTFRFFPKNSVHIIGVDCLYHKKRKAILFSAYQHYFISADNAICSLIFANITYDVYEITLNNRYGDNINNLLIDVFAPAAANLAIGVLPEAIGRKTKDYLTKIAPKAMINDELGIIVGEIIYVDHFGNVVTNITKEDFLKVQRLKPKFQIKFRRIEINIIHKSLSSMITNWENEGDYESKDFCHFNQLNYLEIGIYKGTSQSGASTLFGLDVGEKIFIEFNN